MPGFGQLGGPGLPGKVRIAKSQLTSSTVMEHDNFNQFIKDIERSGHRFMEDLGNKMEKRAKTYAPMRTGRLRSSIKAVVYDNHKRLRVLSDVEYAGVMEHGSRPHMIHGVRANFDWKHGRFVWNDPRYGPIGEDFREDGSRESRRRGHYRRQHRKSAYQNWTYEHGATVRHPGTKPYEFFGRAFRDTWPEARTVMRQAYHR